MTLIDKYVLRLVFGPFVFFFTIFAGIIWLNQALQIVDIVVKNGQSGLVFAELSLYLLPKVSETVVPIAAFSAAIYLTNRLYSESELVVIMGVGRSPGQMVIPFMVFGGFCFLLMGLLTVFLIPSSVTAFQDRKHELSQEYLSQFIVQGEFSTVVKGVTIFFGETTADGNLSDILINDRRNPGTIVTHTATSGRIISGGGDPKLVLFNGSIQRYKPDTRTLSTVSFDSLSFDLSQFAKSIEQRRLLVSELSTTDLLWPAKGSAEAEISVNARVIEAHGRLVKSLLAAIVPVIGAIILISSGFNRAGFFLRIVMGVLFMVAINSVRGLVQGRVTADANWWPILYTPVIIGIVVGILLVRLGMSSWRPKKSVNNGVGQMT